MIGYLDKSIHFFDASDLPVSRPIFQPTAILNDFDTVELAFFLHGYLHRYLYQEIIAGGKSYGRQIGYQ
jgi:hypothetical protein